MDKNIIINQMELSAIAYHKIQPTNPDEELFVISHPEINAHCFMRKNKNELDITFRGTDSKAGWRSNLMYEKQIIPYDNNDSDIRVHAGFLSIYKNRNVRDVIQKFITKNIIKITISGHSLGAALAVLCAIDLQYNFPDKDIEVYLYGCPRVGNEAFVKSYNKRVFKTVRIENGNDVVTKLPFEFMGFYHVGMKIHVGAPRVPFLFLPWDHKQQSYYLSLIHKLW